MNEKKYTVEKIVAGGEGLVRDEGQTIFVPFTIPGEEISIRIEERSSKKIRGKIENIISSSGSRVFPPCPLFEKCGGCDFQHIAYDMQLKIKRDIVVETLSRIAKINSPVGEVAPAPKPRNYRSRIKLHVKGRKAGFYSERKRQFLKVDRCLLAYDSINESLKALENLVASVYAEEIEIVAASDGSLYAVVDTGEMRKTFRRSGNDWKHLPDKRFFFEQVNREQNETLKKLLADILRELKPKSAIELYAGGGNLTEALVGHCSQVVAVEWDKHAIAFAKEKFGKKVEFVAMDSGRFLAKPGGVQKPDLVLLDPPRTGAAEAIDGIIKAAPKNIIYISCDPATFSRDLKKLIAAGFSLDSVTPIDMFPQTAHIELIAAITNKNL